MALFLAVKKLIVTLRGVASVSLRALAAPFIFWPRRHELYIPGKFEDDLVPTFLCRHCKAVLGPDELYLAFGWETRYEALSGLARLNPSLAKCSGKGPKMGLFELFCGAYCTRRMVRENWEASKHLNETPETTKVHSSLLLREVLGD